MLIGHAYGGNNASTYQEKIAYELNRICTLNKMDDLIYICTNRLFGAEESNGVLLLLNGSLWQTLNDNVEDSKQPALKKTITTYFEKMYGFKAKCLLFSELSDTIDAKVQKEYLDIYAAILKDHHLVSNTPVVVINTNYMHEMGGTNTTKGIARVLKALALYAYNKLDV